MSLQPRVFHGLTVRPFLVCLCAVSCAASLSPARAGEPAPPGLHDKPAVWAARSGYACVDPSDALARPRLQDEPCQLPSYQMPFTDEPGIESPPPRQTFETGPAGANAGHAMFWRFPVQGRGQQGAPRHDWP